MVRVEVERPDGSIVLGDGSFLPGSDSVMTDVNGVFVYKYQLNGIEGLYTVRVYDEIETMLATTTFTDSFDRPVVACEPLSGAIWTTDGGCGSVNKNLYNSKSEVYLNGGPQGSGANLPDGDYYVKVTEPDGTLLGDSGDVTVVVKDGMMDCVNLYDLTHFNDTSNPGGTYKVWVSPRKNFQTDTQDGQLQGCREGKSLW